MNNNQYLPSPCAKEALSNGIAYRQLLVAQIAPAFVDAFFNHDAWDNYDEMAGSLMNAVDAILDAERETSE